MDGRTWFYSPRRVDLPAPTDHPTGVDAASGVSAWWVLDTLTAAVVGWVTASDDADEAWVGTFTYTERGRTVGHPSRAHAALALWDTWRDDPDTHADEVPAP